MIDSLYWKEELAKISKILKRVENPKRWSERRLGIVERDIMIGFFLLRRIIELHKVSSRVRDYTISVIACHRKGTPVNYFNRGDIFDLYDFDNERGETKKPLYISNQFIHAYASFVDRDESRNWNNAYVISDYDRNDCIWRIPVSIIRDLFLLASQDYPAKLDMSYNEKKMDYDIKTS